MKKRAEGGFFVQKRKEYSGWLGALAVLLATAWATAPWTALAQRATAPAVPADAAADLDPFGGQDSALPGPKLIALTFDDGPRRATTTALLDGLAQRGVPATFFLIGAQLDHNEDLVLRMEAEGHQIGIHTMDHVKLTGLSQKDFNAQVDATRQRLKAILGHNDFLLRPPYGITDGGVKRNAGCPIILWSIDPEDWSDQNAARVIQHVESKARDGGIILLHDIFPASVEAALEIVDRLHAQGYLFVTVEELFFQRHIPLEPGVSYTDAYP